MTASTTPGLTAAFAALVLAGCAPHQVYELTREFRIEQCQKLELPDRDACVHRSHESFEEYEKRRDEAVKFARGRP